MTTTKRINAKKLAKFGPERLRAVCLRHAVRAIECHQRGDLHKFDLHCDLLDQCARVTRRVLRRNATKTSGSRK